MNVKDNKNKYQKMDCRGNPRQERPISTKKFPGNDDRRNSNAFLKKLFTPRSHKICFSFVNIFSAAAPAGHQIAGPMGPIFYQLSLTGQNVKFCEYDC